jgi:hypothetical protein
LIIEGKETIIMDQDKEIFLKYSMNNQTGQIIMNGKDQINLEDPVGLIKDILILINRRIIKKD